MTAALSGFGMKVADIERSTAFYTECIGLRKGATFANGTMQQLMGGESEVPSLLLVNRTPGAADPAIGAGVEKVVIACDDLAATYERVLAAGGTSVSEPGGGEVPGLTVAMVQDPDGYTVELVQFG